MITADPSKNVEAYDKLPVHSCMVVLQNKRISCQGCFGHSGGYVLSSAIFNFPSQRGGECGGVTSRTASPTCAYGLLSKTGF